MSLRKCTPCDFDGICPYDAQYIRDCEYWCGADEPEDKPDEEFYDDDWFTDEAMIPSDENEREEE